MDGQSGLAVDGVADLGSGIGIPAHPVFGPKQADQFHPGRPVENVNRRVQQVVHAAGIGDEGDLLALQAVEAPVPQNLYARPHEGLRQEADRQCSEQHKEE